MPFGPSILHHICQKQKFLRTITWSQMTLEWRHVGAILMENKGLQESLSWMQLLSFNHFFVENGVELIGLYHCYLFAARRGSGGSCWKLRLDRWQHICPEAALRSALLARSLHLVSFRMRAVAASSFYRWWMCRCVLKKHMVLLTRLQSNRRKLTGWHTFLIPFSTGEG